MSCGEALYSKDLLEWWAGLWYQASCRLHHRLRFLMYRSDLPDCWELFSSSLVSHVKVEAHPNEHRQCLLTDPGTGPCANCRGRARAMPVPLQEHFPSAERSRRDVELQLPILRRICSLFPQPAGMSLRCVCNVFHFPFPICSPELCQACSPQGNPPQLLTAEGQTRQPHRSLPTLKLVRGARQPPTVPALASWQLHRIRTTIQYSRYQPVRDCHSSDALSARPPNRSRLTTTDPPATPADSAPNNWSPKQLPT